MPTWVKISLSWIIEFSGKSPFIKMPVFKKREPKIISIRRPINTNVCLLLAAIFLALSFVVVVVQGHGYLYEPAGRSTLWRYNSAAQQVYPGAVTNSNDMGLNCGGTGVTIEELINILYPF